jgi:fucose permease
VVVVAFLAFVSLGLPDGVLGVAWPSMRATFGVPVSHLGALLAAAMLGYLASSFSAGWLVQRLGIGGLLVCSSVVMVVSCWGYAFTPAWPLMVGGALLAGLGAGAIDAGINAFAAARVSPGTLSWLHACYGVGAMLGPLLMTAALAADAGWRVGYAVLGGLLAVMSLVFVATLSWWSGAPATIAPGDAAMAGVVATLGHGPVWLGVALFFLYTGLEVTAGQWSYTLLTEARGVAPTAAGIGIAVYWGSLTAGRVVAGVLADRLAARTLLRGAMLMAPIGGVLLWSATSALAGVLGLAVLGLALAPVYPLLVAETPRRLGSRFATHAIGFQVSAAYLGAAAIPGAVGVAASWRGLEVVGPALVLVAVAVLALHEAPPRSIADGA